LVFASYDAYTGPGIIAYVGYVIPKTGRAASNKRQFYTVPPLIQLILVAELVNFTFQVIYVSTAQPKCGPGCAETKVTTNKHLEIKVMQSHSTSLEAHGGEEDCSYSFMTLALDTVEWSASRLGRALLPGKDPRYTMGRRLGDIVET
jgi:hypothetical protein